MPRCLIALGSNLGDRDAILDAASESLLQLSEAASIRFSDRLETVPVGGPPQQGAFLNAAATFLSDLDPFDLLTRLQKIEQKLDRRRDQRWDQRSLDLDLLLYERDVIRTPTLRVPHPRMTFRPFVLEPARQLAGEWQHPECRMTLDQIGAVLSSQMGGVDILGDPDGSIRTLIAEARPDCPIGSESPSRLTIDARPEPWPLPLCGPRLALADCPREHWREEVLAALDCVWPPKPA